MAKWNDSVRAVSKKMDALLNAPALIQAVAKAHLWWEWIKDGDVKSLSDIAKREGIDKAQWGTGATTRSPRLARPQRRAMAVLAPVSSMKTSRAGSRLAAFLP